MTRKGEYGEPWHAQDNGLGENIQNHFPSKYAKHIITCVNILDGYDPERLSAFLDECAVMRRELRGMPHDRFIEVTAIRAEEWNEAYDAFIGRVK